MSIVKSFSVGEGDMFYIKHGSDNFTVIDCCLDDSNKKDIVAELVKESQNKEIKRFISTHPDEDHIQGIKYINSKWKIRNFYCVKNEANKDEKSESFQEYCRLRDGDKAFYIYEGCSRKWMNQSDNDRKSSGISILWPKTDNQNFKDQLELVKNGKSPNNISPIIKYSCGAKFLWLGDIETDFLEKIKGEIEFEEIDVLFAPHHGRESGKITSDILKILNPKLIVIGEAPSQNLNYYSGYNTITQNTAGNITFNAYNSIVDIYVGKSGYSVDFLENNNKNKFNNYIGSFSTN